MFELGSARRTRDRSARLLHERPVTSSIAVCNGQYANDLHLIAAASIMIALPTPLVHLLLHEHVIAGLTHGVNRG